jgi:hypothetical protein
MKMFFYCFVALGTVVLFGFDEGRDVSLDQTSFACPDADIPRYRAAYTPVRPVIDGKLDDAVWMNAPRSSSFRDLISGARTHLDTRAAVAWDDEFLYVAYWIEEPEVKATLTKRDAPIYQDNDVELFIAGADGYYEFEINSYATIYEVLFFWEDNFQRNGYASMPEFSRSNKQARPFNGVGFKTHPRGKRIGFWNWDYQGLQKAVHIDGTLNRGDDRDKGWTVELALPWSGLAILAQGDHRELPPRTGDSWRMDFSRFNTHKGGPDDSGGWAWSPHGVWDSHVPECFTYVEFVKP